jgi:hypothetical protein
VHSLETGSQCAMKRRRMTRSREHTACSAF